VGRNRHSKFYVRPAQVILALLILFTLNAHATSSQTLGSLTVTGYPAFAPTGIAQTVTVTAKDSTGAVYTTFTSTPTLTTTDTAAVITPISNSNGVFTYSVTLKTAGTQSITATSGSITGSETGIISTGYVVAISADHNTLSKFTEDGTAFTGNYPATGGGGARFGGAVDAAGNVFSVSQSNNALVEFNSAGTALSGSGYLGGGLNAPQQLAVDGAGQVWIVNSGNNSLSVFTNSGTAVSPATTGYISGVPNSSGAYSNPTSVTIDISGNVWVSSGTGNKVIEVLGAAAPTAPPSTALTNGTTGARP
jgi:hypothetical protein